VDAPSTDSPNSESAADVWMTYKIVILNGLLLPLDCSPDEMEHHTPSRNQQLLASLRESIVDKPPYINGTLQLPDPCFSLFYKVAKDGPAARFASDPQPQLKTVCSGDMLVADILTLPMQI